MPAYVPDTGDLVWLQFDPRAGYEQAGHRPALVLTPARYNAMRGMMIACPLTTKIKQYPFEAVIPGDPPSAVLADHAKSLDWRARGAVYRGKAPEHVLAEVRGKLKTLLGL